MSGSGALPALLQPFFWDHDFARLDWESHRDFIIRRVLQAGSWDALVWLRGELGNGSLRRWIEEQHGGGLSPRQLRFWELLLELPHAEVNRWVDAARNNPWEQRIQR